MRMPRKAQDGARKANDIVRWRAPHLSKREQGRHDPALFCPQHAPGAGCGAAVHHFHADAHIFEFANENPGRLTQTSPGAKQEKFGQGVDRQKITQRGKR